MSRIGAARRDKSKRSRSIPSGALWLPEVGQETLRVLDRFSDLDEAGREKVQNEAMKILGKCAPPTQSNSRTTGLVLGQVQSGKTMSFTTVGALARDNGYQLVVVITGTTIPLLNQSVERLRRDLGITPSNHRSWKHIPVTPAGPINPTAIRDALDDWRDARASASDRQTVLITVMKQHKNLQKLIDVLRTLPLDDVPALVIDDEADQASLNTKVNASEESTTFQKLIALRQCLPRHTFLQYTATPQALLLINIINVLSPVFAELLTPGDEYMGGKAFFIDHPELIREIPAQEVPTRQHSLTSPPDSLFQAMRLFFIGVAAGMPNNEGGNRSMLIHPSVTRTEHAQFHHWVETARQEWKRILDLPDTDPDQVELLTEFKEDYDDLRKTVPGLQPWADLKGRLVLALRKTQVEKVNASAGTTPTIDWSNSYAFILVGGSAMDRGYTVRGLTVTYMPRGLGGGQADTLQQRARFFGYKRSYLSYCRVFLERGVIGAFKEYVQHEEDVRARLFAYRGTGRPLTDWPRTFLLDSAMRPTRNNVIDVAYQYARFGDDWFTPKAPHDSEEAIESNRRIIDGLRGWLKFVPDTGHPDRTEHQRHLVATNCRLAKVYERLLAGLRFTRFTDSQAYVSLLVVLKAALDAHPKAPSIVYLMSGGRERMRSVNDEDEIPTLFQGAAPVTPKSKRGSVYPGDSEIKQSDIVTIQVHNLSIGLPSNRIVANVPTIALWVPPAFGRDVLIQPQGRRQ